MVTDSTAIRAYFAKLGLDSEIADIYFALHTHGPQTISELSRNARVERTRIYRLIDKLMGPNLIEVETHSKRGILRAAPIANLHILIAKKEQELKSLQEGLELIEKVFARNSLSSPATRVQFYEGTEGAKQMLWNQTKSAAQSCSILAAPMQQYTGKVFFERWAARCNEQGLYSRSIVGDSFQQSLTYWRKKYSTEKIQKWEGRYISEDIFPITLNTVIYGDIVSYFNWKDGEVFGIEIYNKQIADSQRQLFELLWAQAQPLKPTTT